MTEKSIGISTIQGGVPARLRHHFDDLLSVIFAAGKPVKTFGFTASGDPKHPLMLGYDTALQPWSRA